MEPTELVNPMWINSPDAPDSLFGFRGLSAYINNYLTLF